MSYLTRKVTVELTVGELMTIRNALKLQRDVFKRVRGMANLLTPDGTLNGPSLDKDAELKVSLAITRGAGCAPTNS
jgi:hypothetical protein